VTFSSHCDVALCYDSSCGTFLGTCHGPLNIAGKGCSVFDTDKDFKSAQPPSDNNQTPFTHRQVGRARAMQCTSSRTPRPRHDAHQRHSRNAPTQPRRWQQHINLQHITLRPYLLPIQPKNAHRSYDFAQPLAGRIQQHADAGQPVPEPRARSRRAEPQSVSSVPGPNAGTRKL
jgi:hypothetical protein